MGKIKKGIYILFTVCFLIIAVPVGSEAASGTWKHNSRGWWYSYPGGRYAEKEWLYIQGKWYYFNADGYMATGWKKLGGKWYYLDPSGAMATGWRKVGGRWYYLSSSGAMVTGWVKINDKWYFMDSSGAMATGWKKLGGEWYYLSSSGAMATYWNRIDGKEYYFDQNGAMVIDDVVIGRNPKMPELDAKVFRYSNDPKYNPSAMKDVVENPNAVFGFSPNPDSTRLGLYADAIDWSDPVQVASARAERAAYFESMAELYTMIETMQKEEKTTEEIARAVSKRRNEIRLEAYKDDPEELAKVKKSNLDTYGNEDGPQADDLFSKYGSWQVVMEKALSTNAGMDACLGFYDEYYYTYGLTDAGAGK